MSARMYTSAAPAPRHAGITETAHTCDIFISDMSVGTKKPYYDLYVDGEEVVASSDSDVEDVDEGEAGEGDEGETSAEPHRRKLPAPRTKTLGARQTLAVQQASNLNGNDGAPYDSQQTQRQISALPYALFAAEDEQMLADVLPDGHLAYDPALQTYTHRCVFTLVSSPALTADALHQLPAIKEGEQIAKYGAAVIVPGPKPFLKRLFEASEIKKLEVEYADPDGKYDTNITQMRVAGAYTLSYNAEALPFPVAVTVVELTKDGTQIAKVLPALNPRALLAGHYALDVLTPGVSQYGPRRLFDHSSQAKKALIADVAGMPNPDTMWGGIQQISNSKYVWVPADSALIQNKLLDVQTEGAGATQSMSEDGKTYYKILASRVQDLSDKYQRYVKNLNIVHGKRIAFILSRADAFSVEAQKVTAADGKSANRSAAYGARKCSDCPPYVAIEMVFAVQYPYKMAPAVCVLQQTDDN
jgi:hypothetical protein